MLIRFQCRASAELNVLSGLSAVVSLLSRRRGMLVALILLHPVHLLTSKGLLNGETGPKGPSLGIGRASSADLQEAAVDRVPAPGLNAAQGKTSSGEQQGAIPRRANSKEQEGSKEKKGSKEQEHLKTGVRARRKTSTSSRPAVNCVLQDCVPQDPLGIGAPHRRQTSSRSKGEPPRKGRANWRISTTGFWREATYHSVNAECRAMLEFFGRASADANVS
ncbi:uncharacterized protein SCHCODRAFT_02493495 [Schizophyllum commune H4-8]|uniref:uncharacterized protein n=1 Tax=Schizophyllum commune (strain H4-8 / FGSC 9210) TaxID=578458 RepID=UPI00215E0369|nr:uncharacterized protein SCHCODRAFT_02493495 [Schizophyllum commune H4-8]KAI5896573.1 hypothetical protein SCHCODRAFT_02493495 [Schizophyllum commune H4-8]